MGKGGRILEGLCLWGGKFVALACGLKHFEAFPNGEELLRAKTFLVFRQGSRSSLRTAGTRE